MKEKAVNLILFGATGDLSRRYVIPALFELFEKDELPTEWSATLFIRKAWTRAEVEAFVRDLLKAADKDVAESSVQDFLSHVVAFEGDLEDKASFEKLAASLRAESPDALPIFYLSISPALYRSTLVSIRDAGLALSGSRILIEKPFGRNLEEARELNALIKSLPGGSEALRVDHYLAKDAMEEILAADFPKKEIERVSARMIEDYLVGNRAAFYDATGAFLDVGQNHLLMMLATALSRISGVSRDAVLKRLCYKEGGIARGQYEGYRAEQGVAPQSATETYFKVILESEDFMGAKLELEAGKGFDRLDAEVEVVYRGGEKISFDFNRSTSGALKPHGKVILAAIRGDSSFFVGCEEVMDEWRIANEILMPLRAAPLAVYPKGKVYKENIF